MFELNKLLIVFLIVENTVSIPHRSIRRDIFYYPLDEKSDAETIPPASRYSSKRCPDKDHSLISHSDLQYLIKEMTANLQLNETLMNNYYPKAKEIHEKHLKNLEEFREELEDRPMHMLHILAEMARSRENLEPTVEEIAAQLQDFDTQKEEYNNIAERSNTLLKQLERYNKICQINCEGYDIETRFGTKKIKNPLIISQYAASNDMSCIKLKDLSEYLNAKLSQFEQEFEEALLIELKYRDEKYALKIHELKINLKEAAVIQFGLTMYDILSLQDDHRHFFEGMNNNNISVELAKIEENSAEIKLRLIGLKRDLEKLRQKCINCNSNRRIKRNIIYIDNEDDIYFNIEESVESFEKDYDAGTDIIQELINNKTNEIVEIIKYNFTAMFQELDEVFDDPDFINSQMTKLKPVQIEIEYAIKSEQEAFYELRNKVPESSIQKILAVSYESTQMIQTLDSAKQYIDRFLHE